MLKKPITLLLISLLWLALAPLGGQAQTSASGPERIEIAQVDGKPLFANLFRPAGAGPFPSVVAMHGCGGLGSRPGIMGARYTDWARRLQAEGYLVIFPDSFGSRGVGPQCLVKDRTVRPGRERVADALATRDWLQARPDVRADRISLLGWSNGGSSVLWTIAADRKGPDNRPDFYKAIAFYPGCRLVAEASQRRNWQSRIPLLILIGEEDTWTPADQCRQLVAMVNTGTGRDQRSPASIITYPKAVHEFDHPDRKLTKRTGLAFTGDNSGEALVGTEQAAREDALLQVPGFLKE